MCILLPSTHGGREAQLLLWQLTVALHLALHGSCSSSELLSDLGSTKSCVDDHDLEKMKGRSDSSLSPVKQQQCGLLVSCHPNHHSSYGVIVEADLVAVTLACKSLHPAPDLKSLQLKWKNQNPNWKRFGKTGEVMWLAWNHAALVAEPELCSGVWCSGGCSGLYCCFPYKSVLEFFYSFFSVLAERGCMDFWWFEVFCFVSFVQYRQLGNGIHVQVSSGGPLGR